jgi:secreted PhoX family phosphatase
VLAGIHNDCSGGQSPWGTVISAEENVQGAYGDLETCWDSNQKFLVGRGFDPGSYIRPLITASTSGEFGRADSIQTRHGRDVYAYLIEIDPGQATTNYYDSVAAGGDGRGHAKLGAIGRARWENATFVTGPDWRLIDGEPIVIYTSDDRRGGRMYKFVSSGVYTEGMTRGEVRALLDEGRLYVSHFEDLDNTTGYTLLSTGEVPTADNPGQGRWILLSVDSTDVPPNAAALGQPNITVGEALRDVDYNGIGGFETQNDVLLALFTTANKLGTSELNRPEDLEWNPLDPSGNPKLYFAFTNHTGRTALDQNGVLVPPAVHSTQAPLRTDTLGSVFALEYLPGVSAASADTFDYYAVWVGRSGQGLYSAANPDNLMIDSQGRVWFGTDGNVGTNGTADAIYLIDQDPSHAAGQPGIVNPTFGEAIRVAATPADAEATGPALSSDERTLFLSVQHPGENTGAFPTSWPQGF